MLNARHAAVISSEPGAPVRAAFTSTHFATSKGAACAAVVTEYSVASEREASVWSRCRGRQLLQSAHAQLLL